MGLPHNHYQRRTITMDCPDYIIIEPERKPGRHLQREDWGAIQRLYRLGFSNRAIAREIHCSPTTLSRKEHPLQSVIRHRSLPFPTSWMGDLADALVIARRRSFLMPSWTVFMLSELSNAFYRGVQFEIAICVHSKDYGYSFSTNYVYRILVDCLTMISVGRAILYCSIGLLLSNWII